LATVQLLPAEADRNRPAGEPLAQHDGVPAGGARPTTGWLPGEVVVDRHALALPEYLAPGPYLLIAALFDPARPGEPRPVVEQDGESRDFVVLRRLDVPPPTPAPAEDGP
jgi:hypothetical protein